MGTNKRKQNYKLFFVSTPPMSEYENGGRGNKRNQVKKNKNKTKSIKLKRLKSTTADWYPTLPNNKVEISIHLDCNPSDRGRHVVSAWGGDDYGIQKFFKASEKKEAQEIFNKICDMPIVNPDDLLAMGLEQV